MKVDKMMKQFQKMQAQMSSIQEELGKDVVEASSGGGMVTVKANGHGDIVGISISKEVVDPEDIEMLEDLLMSAVSEALRKSKELAEGKMNALTAGISIPGMSIPGLF